MGLPNACCRECGDDLWGSGRVLGLCQACATSERMAVLADDGAEEEDEPEIDE